MNRLLLFFLVAIVVNFSFCSSAEETAARQRVGSITKITMSLSAFGVEADDFPSIEVYIDFVKDSSNCVKSFYNPSFNPSSYKLSGKEMKEIFLLLQASGLENLKSDYKVLKTDQPTSTVTIYTTKKKFTVRDYGLEGEAPLQELYKIAYKL